MAEEVSIAYSSPDLELTAILIIYKLLIKSQDLFSLFLQQIKLYLPNLLTHETIQPRRH